MNNMSMKKISRFLAGFALVMASGWLVGCAGYAPAYSPSIDNVEQLKRSNLSPMNVGLVSVDSGLQGGRSMGLRANTMLSPIGESYGDYIANALKKELELANLLDASGKTEISGQLLRNNIDAGGISSNEGQIEARFFVKKNQELRYDKVKKIEMQWDSAFAGAIAIPKAAQHYPLMVQKLITELFSDSDFVKAVRQ